MESDLSKNLASLAERAYKGARYRYTDFLSLTELQEFYAAERSLAYAGVELSGGYPDAERKIVRFGRFDYEEAFPIVCLKISPLNQKFADELTHRDFLGSVLNLGIERSVIGDVVVKENEGYVFCLSGMADYLQENLTRVKHTSVRVEAFDGTIDSVDDGEETSILVTSLRADCMVAAAFRLSRSEAEEAFRAGAVFVDGRMTEGAKKVKEGESVTLRGKGKFRFIKEEGHSKKDRIYITVKIYR
ncbi:MAG: YlmH/Sll1252 family protein [Christensenellaceae bacterium]